MKQRTQKYLHAILALVLSLCLITGCSLFPNSAPKADKNTSQETIAEEATENSSDDSASQPDEAALAAAREAFDQYTENPVSYTHLDVYKRQELYCAPC